MANLTTYLTDAKVKLGNTAAVNRSYPYYFNVGESTVSEWYSLEGGHFNNGTFYVTRLVATHPFTTVPDGITNQLRVVLDRKLNEYNLNAPKPQ